MRVQNVQEVNLYDNHNGQAVIPKLAKAQVELTVNLKPGESVALWFCHESTPEPAASTTLTKIPRKKNPEQEFQSQLILIVTPEIATKQVAASPSR